MRWSGGVYARHGRELMGCKSPVGEPVVMISPVTTSLRQGRLREEGSEGSRRQDPRADEQKRHKRPSIPGEPAPDGEALSKERGRANGAVVRGQLTFLSGEICSRRRSMAMGDGLRTVSKETGSPPVPKVMRSARRTATCVGRGQKSAEVIVAGRRSDRRPAKDRTLRNREEP